MKLRLTTAAAVSLVAFGANTADAQTNCVGEASYQATFASEWTDESHAGGVPSNAHFSPMVVATHNGAAVPFQLGGQASAGVKLLAETGKLDAIKQELDSAFASGDVRAYRTGDLLEAVDSGSVTLSAAPDRSLITMLSMIAPSPDWIVGVPGLNLCQNGEWLSDLALNLPAIDAGTDSGGTLTAENFATAPQGAIFYLDRAFQPTGTPDSNFGVLTITRK